VTIAGHVAGERSEAPWSRHDLAARVAVPAVAATGGIQTSMFGARHRNRAPAARCIVL
jgi:hypothetical protein